MAELIDVDVTTESLENFTSPKSLLFVYGIITSRDEVEDYWVFEWGDGFSTIYANINVEANGTG